MDSFYPKFGEVELVLVEDDNDFYDPLETNIEFEDENEDVKLQLNDTVIEENPFHLNIESYEDESSPEYIIDSDDDVTEVIPEENDNDEKITDPRNNVKAEYREDIDDDSIGTEDVCFQIADSDDSSIDCKSSLKELSTSINGITHVDDKNTTKPNVEESIKPIVPLNEPKIDKQTSKQLPKLNRTTKSKISKSREIKKENKIDKRRHKEEKLVSTGRK